MNSYLKTPLTGMTMLSCLSPTLVRAEQPHGSVGYRYECLDDTRTHADRVEFGTSFSNGVGSMGELRYSTDEGSKDKWNSPQSGNDGTELFVTYRFKPPDDKKFWLEPMLWLDTTQYWSTYKYGPSAGYDFSKEWKVSGRFRYDMDEVTDRSKGYGNDDRNNRRYDVRIDYQPQKANFQYQLNLIYYNNGYLAWSDGHKNHVTLFKVGYKIGSWIPHMSIAGYKGVDRAPSNCQICWRWGLTYVSWSGIKNE